MERTRSLPRRLLLAAVRVDSTDAEIESLLREVQAAAQLDAVIRLARAHGVASLLGSRLSKACGLRAEGDVDWLAADRHAALARHLHASRTVAAVAAAIDRPFVVFKGPALARWYDEPAVRSYSDVDVLVSRSDFVPALKSLVDAGFVELSSNWRGFLTHQVAEVPLGYDVSCVDLHWDVVATGSLREQFHTDVEGMLQRSEWINIGGIGVFTPDLTDTLLHLCLSSGLAGGRRLLQLVDIDRVVRGASIDWGCFQDRAERSQSCALASAVLSRCRRLLDTPVPDHVESALAPFAAWRLLNNTIGERRTSVRQLARGLGSGFVLSAGRDTFATTLASAALAFNETLRAQLGGRGLTDAGGELDWQTTSPMAAEDRMRYLRWVEAG